MISKKRVLKTIAKNYLIDSDEFLISIKFRKNSSCEK